MNIIQRAGILLTLGLPLSACGGPDDPRGPLGVDDASTDSADPDDLTTTAAGDDDSNDSSDSGGNDGAQESCGNGVFDLGEECDDSDTNEVDGCLSDCRFGPLGTEVDDTNPIALPFRGNLGGGTYYDDKCPEGEVLTGMRGRSGLWIDQAQMECGVLQLSAPEDPQVLRLNITPGTVLPWRGGSGGSPYTVRCPADHAVTGFGGRSGASLDQIILRCARLRIVDDGVSMSVGMDESFTLEPVGGNGGGEFPEAQCEPGAVATVGNIRAGVYLDAFGLTCMPLHLVF